MRLDVPAPALNLPAGEGLARLRPNVVLDGDVALARRELGARFAQVRDLDRAAWLRLAPGLGDDLRERDPVGFALAGPLGDPVGRMEGLAFVLDLVWAGRRRAAPMAIQELAEVLSPPARALERWSASRLGAAARRPASAPHVHGFHTYKARFFPRLARFLLDRLDLPPGGTVLDPFSGSGTAPLEAALAGFRATGLDIDPLSCLIARTRADLLGAVPDRLAAALAPARDLGRPPRPYRLPGAFARKFLRRGEPERLAAIEAGIGRLVAAAGAPGDPLARRVARVALSAALVRKFRVRMMGTGVGRFALELAATPLDRLYLRQLDVALRAAEAACWFLAGRPPPGPRFREGDATALDLPDASVDGIVTSPPYLPASSGREAYLVGKAVSLTALGLADEAELAARARRSVGTMAGEEALPPPPPGEPAQVTELVEWLAADPLRRIKAGPVRRYHADLARALREVRRVLRPGGRAAVVVGARSTFYRYRSREVLRRVDCAGIVEELGRRAGLEVEERWDVLLDKRHAHARPRSRDPYVEAAILFRRP